MSLFLPQRNGDGAQWVLFAIFIVLPLVARLVRWVLEKVGVAQPAEVAETSAERRRARREAEREGEDLFRRLARGDREAPPTAAPAPWTRPTPPPSETRAESLESEAEPAPLSVLGEVSEPAEAAETSLEVEEAPAPISALDAPAPALEVAAVRAAGLVLTRADLRRAVLMSEILGPPVGVRPLERVVP